AVQAPPDRLLQPAMPGRGERDVGVAHEPWRIAVRGERPRPRLLRPRRSADLGEPRGGALRLVPAALVELLGVDATCSDSDVGGAAGGGAPQRQGVTERGVGLERVVGHERGRLVGYAGGHDGHAVTVGAMAARTKGASTERGRRWRRAPWILLKGTVRIGMRYRVTGLAAEGAFFAV